MPYPNSDNSSIDNSTTVQEMEMDKPNMLLKWADEKEARPISRCDAADAIRKNRRQPKELRVRVLRKHGETYIASDFLGVGCVIYRALAA
jgi:hypothetical protein